MYVGHARIYIRTATWQSSGNASPGALASTSTAGHYQPRRSSAGESGGLTPPPPPPPFFFFFPRFATVRDRRGMPSSLGLSCFTTLEWITIDNLPLLPYPLRRGVAGEQGRQRCRPPTRSRLGHSLLGARWSEYAGLWCKRSLHSQEAPSHIVWLGFGNWGKGSR
ncbi:hypothetical protein LY78DRAFT_185675 [Colletotrichum sublineola]|nr:hypothetical protein LY78DRAFT_185675 [Colletotrichum sublineola]